MRLIRRTPYAWLTGTVAAVCIAAVAGAIEPRAYVATVGGSVVVIDTATDTVIGSIAAGAEQRLQNLQRLKDRGLITEEEFRAKRRAIIDQL